MARAPASWRTGLLMAVILPFWTSFLIRIYAWIAILKPAGLLNRGLAALHLPAVTLLDTNAGVILVILGLGLGVTMWGLLLGIPIGLAGVLLCLWGLYGRAATESGPPRSL